MYSEKTCSIIQLENTLQHSTHLVVSTNFMLSQLGDCLDICPFLSSTPYCSDLIEAYVWISLSTLHHESEIRQLYGFSTRSLYYLQIFILILSCILFYSNFINSFVNLYLKFLSPLSKLLIMKFLNKATYKPARSVSRTSTVARESLMAKVQKVQSTWEIT